MFSDFAKLFSRDFVLAFFLPSVLFVTVVAVVYFMFLPMQSCELHALWAQKDWAIPLILISCWFLGILLLATNYHLIRQLEGYGILQHTFLLNQHQRKFDELRSKIADLRKEYDKEPESEGPPSNVELKLMKLVSDQRLSYPNERESVLPTEFGNVMRAFENYSLVVYGMDAIPLWPRLSAMIPEAHMDTLNAARAQMDFAVNIVYLLTVAIVEYCVFSTIFRILPAFWIIGFLTLSIWFAYRMAITSAVQWGNLVKASFDLYRNDLLKQMGLERPANWKQERELWTSISQSFLYWEPLEAARSKDKEAPSTNNINSQPS